MTPIVCGGSAPYIYIAEKKGAMHVTEVTGTYCDKRTAPSTSRDCSKPWAICLTYSVT